MNDLISVSLGFVQYKRYELNLKKVQFPNLVSPHLARHSPWKEWLQSIVSTPSILSSIRSRHTGQVGNSVWPGMGIIF